MFQFNHATKLVFGFSLATIATGCGNTATISRANAPDLEGQIVSSDEHNLYVKTAGESAMTVSRDNVTDVDHPGNVAATIGGIITAYGAVNIAAGAGDCDRYGGAYCVGVFLPASIGAPILAYGLYNWMSSTDAASNPGRKAQGSLIIVPTVAADKKNEYFGVSASMRF